MTTDLRYQSMKTRLSGLTNDGLHRIIAAAEADQVCTDTFRYDHESGRFCAMAIALQVPEFLEEMQIRPTDAIVREIVGPVGTVKGLPGTFYTVNRSADLILICREILMERNDVNNC